MLMYNLYISILTIFTLFGTVFLVGTSAMIVTTLQLALDQMPYASSSSITSFIVWFVFCASGGIWVGDFLFDRYWGCSENDSYTANTIQIWCLLTASCSTIVLASDFILNWWLIKNLPRSTQVSGIKIIYHVLNFAVKHKSPVNRSALTYWEEDIPSRMHLGKSRYGGPFTTEQVEDVKTALRLLGISVALWVISISTFLHPVVIPLPSGAFPNLTHCTSQIIFYFSYDSAWCTMITTLLFELVIYPIIGHKLPTILKRIGIVSFLVTVISVLLLLLELVHHYVEDENVVEWTKTILFNVSIGVLIFLCGAVIELVCAQAPHNMRGLFFGYIAVIFFIALLIGNFVSIESQRLCDHCKNSLIIFAIKTGISLFGCTVFWLTGIQEES